LTQSRGSQGRVNARGEFRTNLVFVLFSTPGFFCLVVLGAWLGRAPGVAAAVATYYAILGPSYSFIAMRRGGIGVAGVLWLYGLPLTLAGTAVAVANAAVHHLWEHGSPVGQVASIVVLSSAVYAAFLRLWLPETFSALRTQVVSLLSRRRLASS
jgi:hypothetical protein